MIWTTTADSKMNKAFTLLIVVTSLPRRSRSEISRPCRAMNA